MVFYIISGYPTSPAVAIRKSTSNIELLAIQNIARIADTAELL
jgi:hypothetical protein